MHWEDGLLHRLISTDLRSDLKRRILKNIHCPNDFIAISKYTRQEIGLKTLILC